MRNRPSRTLPLALASFAVAAAFAVSVPSAMGEDLYEYPADGDNPLRIAYTFVAPVGTLLEWTVTRPVAALSNVTFPYRHIDYKGFKGCSRERPSRSCTYVVK